MRRLTHYTFLIHYRQFILVLVYLFLFKFLPTKVTDEEIINICNTYGTLESKVEKQTIEVPTAGGGKIKIPKTNRYVYMKLKKKFMIDQSLLPLWIQMG